VFVDALRIITAHKRKPSLFSRFMLGSLEISQRTMKLST